MQWKKSSFTAVKHPELSEMLMNTLWTVLQICLCVYQNWGGQNYYPPDFCACGNMENNRTELFFLYNLNLIEIKNDQEPELYGRAGIWKSESEIFSVFQRNSESNGQFSPFCSIYKREKLSVIITSFYHHQSRRRLMGEKIQTDKSWMIG